MINKEKVIIILLLVLVSITSLANGAKLIYNKLNPNLSRAWVDENCIYLQTPDGNIWTYNK